MPPLHYQSGPYVCRATGQALNTTSNGNVQFVLGFVVLGTPDPGNGGRYVPSKSQYVRFWYAVITEKTMKCVLEDLAILGFENQAFGRLDPADAKPHLFRDLIIEMYCTHELGRDQKKRERWRVSHKKGSTASRAAVDQAKLAALDQMRERQYGKTQGSSK